MTADVLRQAAELMRERANRATQGPWFAEAGWMDRECGKNCPDEPAHDWHVDGPMVHNEGESIVDEWQVSARDARHVASWHPVVALAVADWLDEAADHLAISEDDRLCDPCPTALEGLECSVLGQALTVARAYLGDPA